MGIIAGNLACAPALGTTCGLPSLSFPIKQGFMHRIELRWLILLLMIAAAFLACSIGFYASYRTVREQLMSQALEANRVYAAKLAQSADTLFKAVQSEVAYSASMLSDGLGDPARVEAEVARLQLQSNAFNAAYAVNAEGRILAGMPRHTGLVGTVLETEGAKAALAQRRPLISSPYISARNNLVVFISHPIFGKDGSYQGYIGGSIYLAETNILHSMLGHHYYQDGSYLYVVDRQRRMIYHQDSLRVRETVTGNPVIEAVIKGEEGAMRVTNSRGVDMLAGYAPVESTGWGVVSQRPVESTLQPLDGLMLEILKRCLPFVVPLFLMIWWLSRLVVKPLRQLAITARHWDSAESQEQIRQVRTWYFEADQLKHAILGGLGLLHEKLGRLNQESITDPLTGLANRRGLHTVLAQWKAQENPFSVVAVNIDNFKQVNEAHGQEVGDKVLQFLGTQMRSISRSGDLLCRLGSKVLLLLPHTSLEEAGEIAERLRLWTAYMESPTGSFITVSAGVAYWPGGSASIADTLKRADDALHQAKREGRNRTVVSPPQEEESVATGPQEGV